MAPLALFFCLVFIAWLLVRDCKRRTSVSAAIWIPTFMLFTLGSKSPSQWFGLNVHGVISGPPNEAAGNWMDQAFFLSLIAVSWIVATSRGVKWSKFFAANTAIMLFYVYFVISSLWSIYPLDSFIRVLKDFGTTVVVILVILSEKDPLEAVRAVYVRCACALLPLSVLFIRVYRAGRVYARNGTVTFVGVGVQKNSLGEMVMVFSLFLILDHLERRPAGAKRLWSGMPWDRLVLLLMAAWLLTLSQSKTSLVCLLIGLALIFGRGWLASRKISRMVLLVALCLPFLLLTPQFRSITAPMLEPLGRDATFTGRTDIWEHITSTTVNPLIGTGFYTFWGGPGGRAIQEAMQTGVPNAHNGYLDIYLDGGLIGLALLLCLLLASGKRLIRNLDVNRYQQMRFAFLIVAIVLNLTESNWGRPSAIWFTTVLVLLEFPFLKANETFSHERQESGNGGGAVDHNDNLAEYESQVDSEFGAGFREETI